MRIVMNLKNRIERISENIQDKELKDWFDTQSQEVKEYLIFRHDLTSFKGLEI
jgi:hypothetical protein